MRQAIIKGIAKFVVYLCVNFAITKISSPHSTFFYEKGRKLQQKEEVELFLLED
jgi:hypothetical protein